MLSCEKCFAVNIISVWEIVSQEHSIPIPSCQKSYHVIKVEEVKIVKEVKKRVMDCDFSELISLQRLENCLSGAFQFHTKRYFLCQLNKFGRNTSNNKDATNRGSVRIIKGSKFSKQNKIPCPRVHNVGDFS